MKVRVLAAAHTFAFGALQSSLIGLPGLQDRELIGCPDVSYCDDIHRTPEPARGIEYRLADVLLLIHDFLLSSRPWPSRTSSGANIWRSAPPFNCDDESILGRCV
jgi:hypothetical protein